MGAPEWLLQFFERIQGDFKFGLLLVICLALSLILRRLAVLGYHFNIDGLIGLSITIFATRSLAACSIIIVAAHLILFKVVKDPHLLPHISFYGTFAYLALLRVIHFVGLPPLIFIANSIQLIMTLRVIGLSYEIADARLQRLKDKSERDTLTSQRIVVEPSTIAAFNYCYSFTGLFTGPYYTYQTYSDSTQLHFLKEFPWELVREKISKLYWSLPALIFFTWLDPVNALRGDNINQYSTISLFFRSALAFVHFRMRIYTAWMIAESICIIAGVGIYPAKSEPTAGNGPKKLQFLTQTDQGASLELSAETINNLDIPHIEHSDGFRSGMRAWNRTVQFWLANFVYKRTRKSIRMPYTMFVSAFWHGIHPGYFLSFLTIPLCTTAEDMVFRVFPADNRPKWFSAVWSFIRMRGFEMMACGFLLLNYTDTIRLWSNLYFWLHCAMITTIILAKAYLITFGKHTSQTKPATSRPSAATEEILKKEL
ncbi:MBOAT, membrane-bound o-acyltransferase family domain-containing protein [Ditylenchus destructor]|nr:MBOAT, membrane-bound o-acyltransferase family domain-containing protein [Ditylenchus destructor]